MIARVDFMVFSLSAVEAQKQRVDRPTWRCLCLALRPPHPQKGRSTVSFAKSVGVVACVGKRLTRTSEAAGGCRHASEPAPKGAPNNTKRAHRLTFIKCEVGQCACLRQCCFHN